ncbi:MAG: flippase-like domain-containing protein [Planctomycetaceae bacterium]|jgi:uncharacterized protein (TIRG00374 family)|nr:flippase-like domain-containing protein [Planctomycetaceae bacterium]
MIFVIVSIVIFFIGHILKMLRWELFVQIYEQPVRHRLLTSISIGHLINHIIPMRVGELVRAMIASTRSKNGFPLMLATVIVDRFLDVIVVGISFILLFCVKIGGGGQDWKYSVVVYSAAILAGLAAFFYFSKESRLPKLCVFSIGRIFNLNIRNVIYTFAWSLISCFKDLIDNVNKSRLILLTAATWFCYFLSYFLLSRGLQMLEYRVSFSELFVHVYSPTSVITSGLALLYDNSRIGSASFYLLVFTLTPAVVMLAASICLSLFPRSYFPKFLKVIGRNSYKGQFIKVIPFANADAKMLFLERYFAAKDRGYCEAYIKANRDISIVKDYSGGSNATTLLIEKDKNIRCFRKYAFCDAASKLRLQADWLKERQGILSLPKILSCRNDDSLFSYDMPFESDAINFFDAIHRYDLQSCWTLLQRILNDVDQNLHKPNLCRQSDEHLQKYIDEKCIKNLETIKNHPSIIDLLRYDRLFINGRAYKNLQYFDEVLSRENLLRVFSSDACSNIHGDLTVENIIFAPNRKERYYLIDPNHVNVHNSPVLDYAKLLQSFHFGYEFLIRLSDGDCLTKDNQITFPALRSLAYECLYQKYKAFLFQKFDVDQVQSIYYHEIIHYLRLTPYKLEKFPQRAAIFFATFIQLLDEAEQESFILPLERNAA